MRKSSAFIAILAGLCLAGTVHATTYHVDAVAGKDANDGQSQIVSPEKPI